MQLFETISEGHLRKLSLYIERKTFPPHTSSVLCCLPAAVCMHADERELVSVRAAVIKQGSMPDFLYFIVNGDCEVLFNTYAAQLCLLALTQHMCVVRPESELIRLALLGKGQLFGEVLSTRGRLFSMVTLIRVVAVCSLDSASVASSAHAFGGVDQQDRRAASRRQELYAPHAQGPLETGAKPSHSSAPTQSTASLLLLCYRCGEPSK